MSSLAWIFWDPPSTLFTIPGINIPITWYGIIFALAFYIAYSFATRLLPKFYPEFTRETAKAFIERLSTYIIIGTVVGARLGHILFYGDMSYIKDPLSIFRTWEGGLASHGGIAGILIALTLFRIRIRKLHPELTTTRLLDFLVLPSLIVAFAIRIGNFINQEILGKLSTLPFAVVFGHAADGSPPVPRHPAQLYEAILYLALFPLFFYLYKKYQSSPGKTTGLLLSLLFTFRFLIEFLKEEQSALTNSFIFNMGQLLSLPLIALGAYLFLRKQKTTPQTLNHF